MSQIKNLMRNVEFPNERIALVRFYVYKYILLKHTNTFMYFFKVERPLGHLSLMKKEEKKIK